MRGLLIQIGPVIIVTGKGQRSGFSILLRIGSHEWEFGALSRAPANREHKR